MATKTKSTIRPLGDRILVKRLEAEEKTAGGIVLPESAKEKPQQGLIIATGPGRMLDNGDRGGLSVSVGDRVFYGKYAGTEVKVEGEELKIMRESDILGILQ